MGSSVVVAWFPRYAVSSAGKDFQQAETVWILYSEIEVSA